MRYREYQVTDTNFATLSCLHFCVKLRKSSNALMSVRSKKTQSSDSIIYWRSKREAKLTYCFRLLQQSNRVQRVTNRAACLVCRASKHEHIRRLPLASCVSENRAQDSYCLLKGDPGFDFFFFIQAVKIKQCGPRNSILNVWLLAETDKSIVMRCPIGFELSTSLALHFLEIMDTLPNWD